MQPQVGPSLARMLPAWLRLAKMLVGFVSPKSVSVIPISRCQTATLVPAAHFYARVLHRCFTHPESRGGRSAEKRSGAQRNTRGACHLASKTRVNALMTRHARRLARRLASHDAGRSPPALHRGGFGLPGPRASVSFGARRPYNGGQLPCGSVQRAPRTQVVVPGGRGPCLPRRAVTSRRRGTPLPAPPSGSSPETPLNERGCECSSMATKRSQERS